MKKNFIFLILFIFSLFLSSCDKPIMYAVSNYSIDDYVKRYQLAQNNFDGGRLPQPDVNRIYAVFAASSHDWKIFNEKLNNGPKGFPVLYAYSNYDLKSYNFRTKKTKVNLEKFTKETIPDSDIIADVACDFYAASKYNIEDFKTRIKEAMKYGLNDDIEIMCYAMSEHPIDVYIKRLADAKSKFGNE